MTLSDPIRYPPPPGTVAYMLIRSSGVLQPWLQRAREAMSYQYADEYGYDIQTSGGQDDWRNQDVPEASDEQ